MRRGAKYIYISYHRIHRKSSFNDSLRMDHLMNSLDGEAKKLVNQLGLMVTFTLQH